MPPRKRRQNNSNESSKRAKTSPFNLKWQEVDGDESSLSPLVVASSSSISNNSKIAAFDIDWTIIKPASGKKFPTSTSDWTFWHDTVPQKLKELKDDGFKIVFVTNQGQVEKGKNSIEDMTEKFDSILEEIGFPIQILMCTGYNHYRKPSYYMWKYFIDNMNGGVQADTEVSIFVGDAAGRAKNWAPGKPKDFSASDRMFAANIGLKFSTPEEFFLEEQPQPFEWNAFDAKQFLKSQPKPKKVEASSEQEMVLLVGSPASGKSSLSEKVFVPAGYTRINRDTLSTQSKCLKATKSALDEGLSVVIDNTNPDSNTRSTYISLAKAKGVPVRCIVMKTERKLAEHLNMYRQTITNGQRRRVPAVGFHSYFKKFESPKMTEGITSIVELPFAPEFQTDEERRLFAHWQDA